MSTTPLIPAGYADWLSGLKTEIAQARSRAVLVVNAELVQLYGRIGHEIVQRQSEQGWGAKVIDRLASDLKESFPEMRGFSSRNLKYMAFLPNIARMVNLGSSLLPNCTVGIALPSEANC